MKLTFAHKYIRNTSTCGTILTEYLMNTGRRPQTAERARKSPGNQVGKKKMRKESRMGPAPLGGSYERGKVPAPWKAPSLVGRSAGTEGELQRLRGECSSRFVAATAERKLHRWSVQCCRPALTSLRCRSTGAGGNWVPELGLWRSDPGRELGLAVQKQPGAAGI